MKKWVWVFLPVVLLFCACGGSKINTEVSIEGEETAGVSYEFVTATRNDVTSSVTLSLSYGTTETVNYSFSVKNGKIEFVYVERGDVVKKGDLLASLESDNLEAKIEDYKYKLASRQLELKQLIEKRDFEVETEEYLFGYTYKTEEDRENTDKAIENIYEKYAMSITTYEDAITILKLRLEEAEKEYKDSRIVADVDGVVSFCKTNLNGTTVTPGDTIIKVSNTGKCRFSSNEKSKAEYFVDGQQYTIVVGNGTSAREYTVTPSNMSEWKSTLFFDVIGESETISLNENGKITIILDEVKDVVTIPTSALHKSKDRFFVYYQDENGVRRMKWVTPGLEGTDCVEIKEGLSEGERIILR